MLLPSSIVLSPVDPRDCDNIRSFHSTTVSVLCFFAGVSALFSLSDTQEAPWSSLLSTLLPFMNQWSISRATHHMWFFLHVCCICFTKSSGKVPCEGGDSQSWQLLRGQWLFPNKCFSAFAVLVDEIWIPCLIEKSIGLRDQEARVNQDFKGAQ